MNKLIIAAAGAGKTTHIVKDALNKDKPVLIVTYTINNEQEIKKKILELNNGIIPIHITIQTWFSMLLQHGVKPYQGYLFKEDVKGMILVNAQSARNIKESNVKQFYFDSNNKIYSDKLSKFVVKCNEKSKNLVLDRLSRIYQHIYIDEVQDLSGYDLEIVKLMFQSNSTITLVGDPRQSTYSTHYEKKFQKYTNGKIEEFITQECKNLRVIIDKETLNCSYRNNIKICSFSSKLYPDYPPCISKQSESNDHNGIFFISKIDIETYLEAYRPIQLRYSKKQKINDKYNVMNFGESKGLGFDHVLIYPTDPIKNWIVEGDNLAESSRAKLYVAITRAKHSVAFVYDYKDSYDSIEIIKWKNPEK